MIGDLVTIENYYKDCKVIPSLNTPESILLVLNNRNVHYGICNTEKIIHRYESTIIEVKWYTEYRNFITKFWHEIRLPQKLSLIHMNNGNFNIDDTLAHLDIIEKKLYV